MVVSSLACKYWNRVKANGSGKRSSFYDAAKIVLWYSPRSLSGSALSYFFFNKNFFLFVNLVSYSAIKTIFPLSSQVGFCPG
jgi:hypothetical protein